MILHLGMRARMAAAGAACLAGAVGCWDDTPTRMAVDGMVIFGRAPLDNGAIQFVPEVEDPKKAFHVGAPIEAGQFRLDREDGLVPGRYKVRIHSVKTVPLAPGEAAPNLEGPPTSPGAPPAPVATHKVIERIPDRYNHATTLTAEIKPTWPNTLTFVLEP